MFNSRKKNTEYLGIPKVNKSNFILSNLKKFIFIRLGNLILIVLFKSHIPKIILGNLLKNLSDEFFESQYMNSFCTISPFNKSGYSLIPFNIIQITRLLSFSFYKNLFLINLFFVKLLILNFLDNHQERNILIFLLPRFNNHLS